MGLLLLEFSKGFQFFLYHLLVDNKSVRHKSFIMWKKRIIHFKTKFNYLIYSE